MKWKKHLHVQLNSVIAKRIVKSKCPSCQTEMFLLNLLNLSEQLHQVKLLCFMMEMSVWVAEQFKTFIKMTNNYYMLAKDYVDIYIVLSFHLYNLEGYLT